MGDFKKEVKNLLEEYQEKQRVENSEGYEIMKRIAEDRFPELDVDSSYVVIKDSFNMDVYITAEEMIQVDRLYNFAIKTLTSYGVMKQVSSGWEITTYTDDSHIIEIQEYDNCAYVRQYYKTTGERVPNVRRSRKVYENNKGRYINVNKVKVYLNKNMEEDGE